MNTNLLMDPKNSSRTLTVEQSEPDYIEVKKKLKNAEYSVEMLVFKKEDIDELLKIQEQLYTDSTSKKALIERLLVYLKRNKRQRRLHSAV